MHRNNKRVKAIIAGSGIAGLASAIRLALQNIEVKVFEKNDYPGGKISHLKMNEFSFDKGPSLFTQPENIEELFKLANENISDYFTYRPVSLACRYFYEDGTTINAYTNTDLFVEELVKKNGEDKKNIENYFEASRNIYENIGDLFLNNSLHTSDLFFKKKLIKALSAVKWKYIFHNMNSIHQRYFKHANTVQLFNRYATYVGSNPYKVPGMLCMIPHLEYNEGVFYPKGGMISITNALFKLAEKKGVQFTFNTPVQQIIVTENKAAGIVANNQNISADIIVTDLDAYYVYKNLLNDDQKAERLLKQERSSSALVFYWGMGKEFPQLDLHNIFFAEDYKKEFDHLFQYKIFYSDPTIYINITSKYEPHLQAPPGKENWFVMINAPATLHQQNRDEVIKQCKTNIIAKLNRLLKTDIESFIETEGVLDPQTIENNTASFMGSLYGTSSNSKMSAFLRHPNFSKNIKGLYFAGGSVHPGGGIPLCLRSADIVSRLIKKDFKK